MRSSSVFSEDCNESKLRCSHPRYPHPCIHQMLLRLSSATATIHTFGPAPTDFHSTQRSCASLTRRTKTYILAPLSRISITSGLPSSQKSSATAALSQPYILRVRSVPTFSLRGSLTQFDLCSTVMWCFPEHSRLACGALRIRYPPLGISCTIALYSTSSLHSRVIAYYSH